MLVVWRQIKGEGHPLNGHEVPEEE